MNYFMSIMDEQQFEELKKLKMSYKEFQETSMFKDLIGDIYTSYPHLPYININLMLYAWYTEMVLEEALPEIEEQEPIPYEVKGIEVYDKVDYHLKYYDIIEQEKKHELKPMTEEEYQESQKLENKIEAI